jgi:glycerophosphoryl diester phosphodiesterase
VPLLYGHRGAPATGLPENTIASFQRALDDGATAIETDVHRTKDGVVVVAHDAVQHGVTIAQATLAELKAIDLGQGERIPTLRELLDRFRDVPINVDIKPEEDGIERSVIDAVGDDSARVLLASFHGGVITRVRWRYRGPTGVSPTEVAMIVGVPGFLLRRVHVARGGQRAQVPLTARGRRLDTERFIDKCHSIGVKVDYWVINDVEQARRLLAIGADGIMSDAPGVVKPAFA